MRSPSTTRTHHRSAVRGPLAVARIGAAFALALDVTVARNAIRRLTGAAPPGTFGDDRSEPVEARLVVERVDDPNGRMRLLAARGVIDEHTVGRLILALGDLPHGERLHLDLSDAELSSFRTMRRLERTVDELELRGVRVRIVGVDPEHPALAPPARH